MQHDDAREVGLSTVMYVCLQDFFLALDTDSRQLLQLFFLAMDYVVVRSVVMLCDQFAGLRVSIACRGGGGDT